MLLFNKAVDINHTLLRFACLILELDFKAVEKDRLRIYDFLVANPAHIAKLSLPMAYSKSKNQFRTFDNRYQKYDPRGLFELMRPIQDLIFAKLDEMGALEKIEGTDRFLLCPDALPDNLASVALDKENSISTQAIGFIKDHLSNIELLGPQGLKQASKLMEYKYDAI